MAEENKLNAKIQLRNDSLDNWNKNSTVILQKGEVGFVEIPGNNASTPTILFKVGDGKTQFAKLPWVTALAADVYAWAKAEHKPTYTASEVGVTEANFPGLNKTGTVTSVKLNGTAKTPTNGVVDLGNNILTVDSSTLTKDHLINWGTGGIEDSGIDKTSAKNLIEHVKYIPAKAAEPGSQYVDFTTTDIKNIKDLNAISAYLTGELSLSRQRTSSQRQFITLAPHMWTGKSDTSEVLTFTGNVTQSVVNLTFDPKTESNILTDHNINNLYAEESDINALFGITSTIASENTTASENTVVRE